MEQKLVLCCRMLGAISFEHHNLLLFCDIDRSKNTKSAEDDQNEENQRNSELGENAVGSGMFKHMKSIDDKVNQV